MAAAVICGLISLVIINNPHLATKSATAGAAAGFAISVGLLGVAAAIAQRANDAAVQQDVY